MQIDVHQKPQIITDNPQTKYIWSRALDEADVNSATHDMLSQCGVGGQPKLDLLSTYTRL